MDLLLLRRCLCFLRTREGENHSLWARQRGRILAHTKIDLHHEESTFACCYFQYTWPVLDRLMNHSSNMNRNHHKEKLCTALRFDLGCQRTFRSRLILTPLYSCCRSRWYARQLSAWDLEVTLFEGGYHFVFVRRTTWLLRRIFHKFSESVDSRGMCFL